MNRFASCLLLSSFLVSISNAEELRYEDLPARIDQSNGRVQGARFTAEAAESRVGHFGRSFLPSVELNLGRESFRRGSAGTLTPSTGWGATARLNLFNGGRDLAEDQVLRSKSELSRFEQILGRQEELSLARMRFWEVLAFDERTRILSEAAAMNEQNAASAERRIRAGIATEADRVEFQLKKVAIEQDLARARADRGIALSRLKVLLGVGDQDLRPIGELTHLHDWEKEFSPGEVNLLPLAQKVEAQAQLAEAVRSVSAKSWLPSLDLYGGFVQPLEREESGTPSDRRETYLGIGLRFDVGSAVKSGVESRAARLERDAATSQARFERSRITEELKSQVTLLRLLHSQLHEADENVKRGESYLKLTRSEYGRGVKNSVDMLNASERYLDYKERRLSLLLDFQATLVQLKASQAR